MSDMAETIHLTLKANGNQLAGESSQHDPVLLVDKYAANLRRLKGIYVDCGWRDQYHIHYGSRQLSRALEKARVTHHYEEFDDTHSDIDYRMDVSLPFLYRALRP